MGISGSLIWASVGAICGHQWEPYVGISGSHMWASVGAIYGPLPSVGAKSSVEGLPYMVRCSSVELYMLGIYSRGLHLCSAFTMGVHYFVVWWQMWRGRWIGVSASLLTKCAPSSIARW